MSGVQVLLHARDGYGQVEGFFRRQGVKRVFLVCGKSAHGMAAGAYLDGLASVCLSGFTANPAIGDVVGGLRLFQSSGCDGIAAMGGGSAMDVAKCIKLWANLPDGQDPLDWEPTPNAVPLLAVPTTAGSGSEATHFAVVYAQGEKHSVAHEGMRPGAVLFDPGTLDTLPVYHRKSSMLDALCHSIESYWSKRACGESRGYAQKALGLVWKHKDAYLANTPAGNDGMQQAAFWAGRAIDLSQTTAGHAMCYKLTTLYDIAHGHAAALCNAALWPYMAERGTQEVKEVLAGLAAAMGCGSTEEAIRRFCSLPGSLGLARPVPRPGDFEILCRSVNKERLQNNPMPLDGQAIEAIYHKILGDRL